VIDAPVDGSIVAEKDALHFHWQVVDAHQGAIPRGSSPIDPFGLAPAAHRKGRISSLFQMRAAHADTPAMRRPRLSPRDARRRHRDAALRLHDRRPTTRPTPPRGIRLRATGDKGFSVWVMIGDFEDDQLVPGSGPFKGPWIVLAFAK